MREFMRTGSSHYRASTVVYLAIFVLSGLLCAAEPNPLSVPAPVERRIQISGGTQIDLAGAEGLSDAELADTLETAAQRLRPAKGKVVPANLKETAKPSAEALPISPTSATANACPCEAPNGSGAEPHGWHDLFGLESLPSTLLFEPPLANPWSPRMYMKFTGLHENHLNPILLNFPELREQIVKRKSIIDTAIGGEAGLARYTWDKKANQAVQFDAFALVLTRFSDNRSLIVDDYRLGFPVTFAYGAWEAKFGYEHTSSHVGDGLFKETGQFKVAYIHDDLVTGLAYRFWNQFRAYTQLAYGRLNTPVGSTDPFRVDLGLEWCRRVTTDCWGQPFAAFDLEMRADSNYQANTTLQAGWQWKNLENGHALRLALEYYNGVSTFGQFHTERQHWVGFGIYFDF